MFHTYIGYAGWSAGQLEHEVDLGAWHVMPADAGTVFHADPDSVWERLIRRTETQIAVRYSSSSPYSLSPLSPRYSWHLLPYLYAATPVTRSPITSVWM